MGSILLIIGICIVAYNVIVNTSNLSKLIGFCFNYNTLNGYWGTYAKFGFHGRAIFSSIIGFVIALIVYIILAPIIIVRQVIYKKATEKRKVAGLYFEYSDNYKLEAVTDLYTNIEQIGLKQPPKNLTGITKIDLLTVLTDLTEQYKTVDKKVDFDVMQEINLGGKVATIPILVNVYSDSYPVYLIYTEEHAIQYKNINQELQKNGIIHSVYYSVLPIEEPTFSVKENNMITA